MKEETKEILSSISKTTKAIYSLFDEDVDREDVKRLLPAIIGLISNLDSCTHVLRMQFPEETKAHFREMHSAHIRYSSMPGFKQDAEKLAEELEIGKDFPLQAKGTKTPEVFKEICIMYEAFDLIRSNAEIVDLSCLYLPKLGGIERPVCEAIFKLPPLSRDSKASIKQWANVMADACMLCEEMNNGTPVSVAPNLINGALSIFENSVSILNNLAYKEFYRLVAKHREVVHEKKHETDPDFDPAHIKVTRVLEDQKKLHEKVRTRKFQREATYRYIKNKLEKWLK